MTVALYAWLVPRVVLPAYERLTGRRLWTEVRRLRELQWRSPAELEAHAIDRLRPLLAHAAAHVPFYRELFGDAGVDPRRIRSTEDLARLPIVDKAALRRRSPDDVTASNLRARRRWKSVTSGSSGFPFEFYADPAAADETLGSYLFFLEWAGAALWQTRLDLGVRQGRSWGTAPWLASRASRLGRRLMIGEDIRLLLAADLGPEELCAVVARIHRRTGYFIRAYPAYAGRLAAALVDRGIELPRSPTVVISSSETLTGARAAAIRQAFRAPVVNHYSCWEVLHLAQTCPDNPEVLHVNVDRAISWVARADGTPARRGLTSGSTGAPFEFFLDRAGTDAWLASYLFFLEWAGAAVWHTEVVVASPRHLYPPGRHVGPWAARVRRGLLGREQLWLGGPGLTAEALAREIARVARRGPYFLWAYASYAGRLASELLDRGHHLPVDPVAVITAAETLTAPAAAAVASAFRKPAVNHYSCLEIPRIAQSCPDNPGVFHVNSERAVVRVLDSDGKPVAPGERGRVVITDLWNDVMPFINYELGDFAVLAARCPCGRGFPTLAAVEGRLVELLVTTDDRVVSPAVLGQYLMVACRALPYVWEYQAIQREPGGLELRVVPTARFTGEFARDLHDKLETLMGPGSRVLVEIVDAVEREPSGKRLVIKSGVVPGAPRIRSAPPDRAPHPPEAW